MISRALLLGFTLVSCAAVSSSASAGYKPEERYDTSSDRVERPYAKPRRKSHGRAPYRDCCEGYRFVYAESWQGFKQVVAPVRRASLGEQVRLPSGNWVYCEFSCEYTLRKQSLDFWEGVTSQGSVSPGLFRKDFYLDGHSRRW